MAMTDSGIPSPIRLPVGSDELAQLAQLAQLDEQIADLDVYIAGLPDELRAGSYGDALRARLDTLMLLRSAIAETVR